jgi:hypothetical protein
MKKRIISHAGLTIDMKTIKCFKVPSNIDSGKTNFLIVEHKKRIEYIKNPETDEYEKIEFNDVSEVEFPNYEMADAHKNEWEDIWENYLNEE